jgi:hypothetical protein
MTREEVEEAWGRDGSGQVVMEHELIDRASLMRGRPQRVAWRRGGWWAWKLCHGRRWASMRPATRKIRGPKRARKRNRKWAKETRWGRKRCANGWALGRMTRGNKNRYFSLDHGTNHKHFPTSYEGRFYRGYNFFTKDIFLASALIDVEHIY